MIQDHDKLASQTQDVYERQADWFAENRRQQLTEKPWLDHFLSHVPDGGHILDLGCGTGKPIAAYILGQGYRVMGLDASANMIAHAKSNFPDAVWQVADMRDLDLGTQFDGIIGWHSFFHLTRDEQRDVLPNLARHLCPEGVLMLTVGPEDGEAHGHVGDAPIYHSSLAEQEYEDILGRYGMTLAPRAAPTKPEDSLTVLFAQKTA